MNVLDIVLIVLILLCALIGAIKGFFKTLISFISNVGSLILAGILAKPLATLFNNWFGAAQKLAKPLTKSFQTMFTDFNNLTGEVVMNNHCTATGFMKSILNSMIKSDVVYESHSSLTSYLANIAGKVVLLAICTVISLILIKIVLSIIGKLFKFLKEKSLVIHGLDRSLGVVLGILQAAIIIVIVFSLAKLLQPVEFVSNALDIVFKNSKIAKPLFDFVTNNLTVYIEKLDINSLLQFLK